MIFTCLEFDLWWWHGNRNNMWPLHSAPAPISVVNKCAFCVNYEWLQTCIWLHMPTHRLVPGPECYTEESNPTCIWHWNFAWELTGTLESKQFFCLFCPPKDRSYFAARYAEAMGIKLRSQQEGPGGPTLSGLGYKQDINHCTQTTPHYIHVSHSSQLRI